MNRRRFLKYAGATAVTAAAVLGIDFVLESTPITLINTSSVTTSSNPIDLPHVDLDVGRKLDGLLRTTRQAMAEAVLPLDPTSFNERTSFRQVVQTPSHLHALLTEFTESNGIDGVALKVSQLVTRLGMSLGNRDALVAIVAEMNSLSPSVHYEANNGVLTALLAEIDSHIHLTGVTGDSSRVQQDASLFDKIVASVGFSASQVSTLAQEAATILQAEMQLLELSDDHIVGIPYTFSDDFCNEPLVRRHYAFLRAINENITRVDGFLSSAPDGLTSYLKFLGSSNPMVRKWARYGSLNELEQLDLLGQRGLDLSVFDFANDPFEFGRLAALLKISGAVPSVESRMIEALNAYGMRRATDLVNYARLQAIPMNNGNTYDEVIRDLKSAQELERLLSFDFTRYTRATTNAQNICPNSQSAAPEIILNLKESIKRRFAEKYNWSAVLCMNNPPKYSGDDYGKSFEAILESLKSKGSTTDLGANYFLMHMLLQYSNYISGLPGPEIRPFAFTHLIYSGKRIDGAYYGVFLDKRLYHHDAYWLWYIGDNTFASLKRNHGKDWAYSFSGGVLAESFPILDGVLLRDEFAKYAPSWLVSAASESH